VVVVAVKIVVCGDGGGDGGGWWWWWWVAVVMIAVSTHDMKISVLGVDVPFGTIKLLHTSMLSTGGTPSTLSSGDTPTILLRVPYQSATLMYPVKTPPRTASGKNPPDTNATARVPAGVKQTITHQSAKNVSKFTGMSLGTHFCELSDNQDVGVTIRVLSSTA
jgi:hypothetical protein